MMTRHRVGTGPLSPVARPPPCRHAKPKPPPLLAFPCTLLLLLAFAVAATVDAQFLGGGGGGSGGGTTCPVDITKVRVDSTLAKNCDPEREDLCDACLCDFAERLLEAGYQVTGPDAVPFQECALQNLAPLQKVGLTIGMMFAVSSRCKEEPACVQEYAARYAQPSPQSTTAGAKEDETLPANASASEALSDAPGAATAADAATVKTEATAATTEATTAEAATTTAGLPSLGPSIEVSKFSSRQKLITAVAVPSVFAAAAAWVCFFVLVRERQRKNLAAQHVASLETAARDGVNRLEFDDITCVLRAPGGCAWRRRERVEEHSPKRGLGRGSGDEEDVINDANDDDNDGNESNGDDNLGGRVLLNHVSGHASRGQILALLGPSGAGKSTLLKVIAGRSPSSVDAASGLHLTSGEVTLDGIRTESRDLSRAVAMVPQEDNLLPFLTVLETVMYSAELRLPWFTPRDDKRAKALAVLEELGLSGVANSRVGGGGDNGCNGGGGGGGIGGFGGFGGGGLLAGILGSDTDTDTGDAGGGGGGLGGGGGSGVSGGERRRTVVAMELVTSPDVIVLDEPTSGLDAAAAASMVFTLRSLASGGAGRVVVFSVHQPSPRAFRALDRVMLLGTGGRLLWAGAPEAAEFHFASAGLPCPVENVDMVGGSYRVDISEWMLEVASCPEMRATLLAAADGCNPGAGTGEVDVVVVTSTAGDRSGGDDAGNDAAATAAAAAPAAAAASASSISAAAARLERRLEERRRWKSTLTEMRVLLRRSAVTISRDPSLLVAHFAVASLTGLLLGCLYLDSPLNLAGFQNRAGGIFFTLVFFGLASISAADRIAAESAVRAREIRSGYYASVSYVFATVVTDVAALRAPPALIYAVVLYFMMGLRRSASAFFTFLSLLELFVACTSLLCSFISLSAPSPAVANLIATFSLLLSAMFGGFLVSIASIPLPLRWLQWLSAYRYAWGGMLGNEMNGQTFLFDTEFEGADVVIEVSGQTYLNTFGLDPKYAARDAAALGGIFVCLGVASCLTLALGSGSGWRFRRRPH